jgi:hypothetical protein
MLDNRDLAMCYGRGHQVCWIVVSSEKLYNLHELLLVESSVQTPTFHSNMSSKLLKEIRNGGVGEKSAYIISTLLVFIASS